MAESKPPEFKAKNPGTRILFTRINRSRCVKGLKDSDIAAITAIAFIAILVAFLVLEIGIRIAGMS